MAKFLTKKDNKMNKRKDEQKMRSYLTRLVQHLIKIEAQQELALSWVNTIKNALKYIQPLANYEIEEWDTEIEDIWEDAMRYAAEEVDGGIRYKDLEAKVDKDRVVRTCLMLLLINK